MNFQDKFNLIIETIEENLDKEYSDYKSVTKELGRKLGTPSRIISDTFRFVTDVTLGSYIMKRKLAAAYQFKNRNQCSWEDAAEKYGYSEVSAFRRAFKNAYGVTPSELGDAEHNVRLVEPMSIDAVLKNQNEEEKEMMGMRRCEYSDTIRLAEDAYNSEQQILFKAHDKKEHELINDIIECQSLFGLDLSMVMLVHTMLNEENTLYIACEYAARAFGERNADTLTNKEKRILHFVINCEMESFSAEEAADLFADVPVEQLKKFSPEYIAFSCAMSQYRKKEFTMIPYAEFQKVNMFVNQILDRKLMEENMRKNDFLSQKPFYWDSYIVDDVEDAALRAVGQSMSDQEIMELGEKTSLTQHDKDVLFLIVHYAMKKEMAEWIAEHICGSVVDDVRKIDRLYLEISSVYVEEGKRIGERYDEFEKIKREIINRGYNDNQEEMIHDIFLRGYSLEEAIENEENKKRIKNIAKTYGVEFMKIRFAEEISNSYTGTEKAYQMMKTTYSEKKYFSPSPAEKDAKHLTVRDRLALILCLNTDKDIWECEKQVDQLMRDEVLTEEELWDYLSVNVYQSKHRHSDEFRLFTAHEFVKAKGVSKNTELDSPFYWWLILAFCERGMAESIEKAFELVLKKYETRKQNERMN